MKSAIVTLFLIFSGYSYSFGQELVYKPKNPAFGGDTFNYQWLLSSADTQNTYTDSSSKGREEKSDLERFTEGLNNQLLSQISRTLFNEQFGTNGLTEGTYTFGTLFIEIFPSGEGLVVNVLDTSTGDQSQVIIPN